MTIQPIPAVYQDGILKPLKPLNLANQQRVVITLETLPEPSNEEPLQAWEAVYADLSEKEIVEIEAIALHREHFMLGEAKE